MADPQFEEFSTILESLPQHIRATPYCYQIAHGIDDLMLEENGTETTLYGVSLIDTDKRPLDQYQPSGTFQGVQDLEKSSLEVQYSVTGNCVVERKRRKLPQIPLDKKPLGKFGKLQRHFYVPSVHATVDQKNNLLSNCKTEFMKRNLYLEIESSGGNIVPYLRCRNDTKQPGDDECSPEDAHERLSIDVDSGNSSLHTPDGIKSFSPANNDTSPSSSTSSVLSASHLHLQDATHRGLHKFVPRHDDEIEVEIGDPVYVQKEADDNWFEGVNLRTGVTGIFPSAYVTDVEYTDFDPDGTNTKKERYLLDFLGSIEVSSHKGNNVLLQAVRKVVKSHALKENELIHPCILEISDNGLRMVNRNQKSSNNKVPSHDFFFNLKNVTFCGYHPYNHRYFGFVTKHPLMQKFACHIFVGEASTRDVAEAVGRAFQRFYQKFMETMYPIEDIYLE